MFRYPDGPQGPPTPLEFLGQPPLVKSKRSLGFHETRVNSF